MAFRADTLERLAEGDAFAALGLTRRDALWAAHALRSSKLLPMFGANGEGVTKTSVLLPQMTFGQEVIDASRARRLSLRAHPMNVFGQA
ncbi:hypothetical protein [Fuscibacter oryzae]|uniref:Uncharacterized protein n=1 Tax=Fuscibacter oryzae TaxID=2803939 RepID=A0A8J7MP61_9RHOB|nr:hypothetical protein [Fuscibacter oryzae]MBL4928515.1 hypothetical protein [Fuscibacter oryzae]